MIDLLDNCKNYQAYSESMSALHAFVQNSAVTSNKSPQDQFVGLDTIPISFSAVTE